MGERRRPGKDGEVEGNAWPEGTSGYGEANGDETASRGGEPRTRADEKMFPGENLAKISLENSRLD